MTRVKEIDRLHRSVAHLREQGFYKDALGAASRACHLARASLAPTDQGFQVALNDLASLYKLTGRYQEAEALYRELLTIIRGSRQQSPALWAALNNLGLLYVQMGRFSDAEPLLQEAADIARYTHGEKSDDYALGLNNLGGLHRESGNYSVARVEFSRALQIMRVLHGEQHPYTAQALNNLGLTCLDLNEYAEAEICFQSALEKRRSMLQPQHPDIAQSLNNLGLCLMLRGNYAAADPLFREALEISARVLGEAHPLVAQSLANLALLYEETGNYSKAEQFHLLTARSFRESLGDKHPFTRAALNAIGLLYVETNRFEEAEKFLHEALEFTRAAVGETHADFAQCLNNIGLLRLNSGKPAEAEALFRRALQLRRSLPDIPPEALAVSLNNLALALMDSAAPKEAEPLLKEVIKRRQALHGDEHPSVEQALFNLGVLYARSDRLPEALELLQRAAQIDNQILDQVVSIGSEQQQLACLMFLYQRLQMFLSLVLRLSSSTAAVEAAFALVLRRKGIIADVLASQRQNILQGRYPHLTDALRELTELREQILVRSFALIGAGSGQPISRLEQRKERLEAMLAAQIPELARYRQPYILDATMISDMLPAGSALIEFVRMHRYEFSPRTDGGSPRWIGAFYIAFVRIADAQAAVRLIDLGEAEPIDSLIGRFRASVSGGDRHFVPGPHDDSAVDTAGENLRHAVWDPLLDAIGQRRRLLIAPDGDLTRVPFEALPAADEQRLIDRYHISYLTTARDLHRIRRHHDSTANKSLVVGDPQFELAPPAEAPKSGGDYTARRQSEAMTRDGQMLFRPLPGTRRECDAIARLLGVAPVFGESAVESRVKACASPLILHLATHGFFLSNQQHPDAPITASTTNMRWTTLGRMENPMLRSGLALAGANTWLRGQALPAPAEDGILNAEDVSGLDLTETELVVLSACETGLGDLRVGEGVFGLRRAVMIAGAKTLVMSLWKVPDQQTEELMVDFYQRVLGGTPVAKALREAQLEVKSRHPNPSFWGAFICLGNPEPLLQA